MYSEELGRVWAPSMVAMKELKAVSNPALGCELRPVPSHAKDYRKRIQALRQTGWIDHYTKAVAVKQQPRLLSLRPAQW